MDSQLSASREHETALYAVHENPRNAGHESGWAGCRDTEALRPSLEFSTCRGEGRSGAWGQAPACFVIAESLRQFYYRGLCEWRQGRPTRLLETSRTGQDVFTLALRTFGYAALADKAEVEIGL